MTNQPDTTRKIAFDSAISYSFSFIIMVLGFATKVLLAKILAPADLGLLLTGQAVIGLLLVVARLSLPEAVARFIGMYAGHDDRLSHGVLKSTLWIGVLGGVFSALILMAGRVPIVSAMHQEEALASVLVILAMTLPLTTVGELLAGAARGIGQLWVKVVLADLVRPLGLVIALSTFMMLGVRSIAAAAGAYLGATALSSLLVSLWWLRSSLWPLHAIHFPLKQLLAYSLPLLGAELLGGPVVNSLIPLLLAGMVSAQSVAYYSLAGAFTVFVNGPLAAVELAALPFWAGHKAKAQTADLRSTYSLFTRWCLILGLILFAPLVLTPAELLSALYTKDYAPAAPLVRLLAGMALFGVAIGPNNGMLKALGYTRWILFAQFIAGIAAMGVALIFIRSRGAFGAALAFAVSGALLNLLFSVPLLWQHNIHPITIHYLKTIIAGGGALFITAVVRGHLGNGIVNVVMTMATYATMLFGLLFAIKGFDIRDRQIVREWVGGVSLSGEGKTPGIGA